MMNKRSLYLLALASLLTACSESSLDEATTIPCDMGTFDGVIIDSIFEPVVDESSVTHKEKEQCISSNGESCVEVYNKPGHYACSHYSVNYFIECDGKKTDARTDIKNCGKCGHGCIGDDVCIEGQCVLPGACTPESVQCDSQNQNLLKCNVNGEWKVDQVCESGVCSNDACAEKVCDAGAKQCAADGKTPQVCENNAWKNQTACEKACNNGECTVCDGNEVKCSDDGKSLLTCKNGQWETKVCGYACESNACFDEQPIDTDGDGVPDIKDPCPYNPKFLSGVPETCISLENDTLYIYHAENLYDAAMILSGKGAFTPTWGHIFGLNVKNIEFKHDVNMADLPNTSVYGVDCVVNNWDVPLYFNKLNVIGNGHRITSVGPDGRRCALPQPLAIDIKESTVTDLTLDYDVKDGQGLLANRMQTGSENAMPEDLVDLKNNVLENITFSGTLHSNAEENVGGLVGEVRAYVKDYGDSYMLPNVIKNCYADGVSVIAPRANNVGGFVGKTWGAEYSFNKDKIMKINKVEGQDNVGGIFGFDPVRHDKIGLIDYLSVSFDQVKGRNYVGGFVGAGWVTNVVAVGNEVLGDSEVGGLVGNCVLSNTGSPYSGCSVINDAIQVGRVESSGDEGEFAGGVIGRVHAYSVELDKVLMHAKQVKGRGYVGGLIGEASPANFNISNFNVRADRVDGDEIVGGVIGSLTVSNGSAANFSVLANLYAMTDTTISGFAGKLELGADTVKILQNSTLATARFSKYPSCKRIWKNAVSVYSYGVNGETSSFYKAGEEEVAFDSDNLKATPVSSADVVAATDDFEVESFKLASCGGEGEEISFYGYKLEYLSAALDKLIEATKSEDPVSDNVTK